MFYIFSNTMMHEEYCQTACDQALLALKVPNLRFRPMRRNGPVKAKHGYVIGRTNLKTGLITIDIYTPKERRPKKISSILRTLCHEVAHHQKPPYRQRYRGRTITRQHFPGFYKQVNRNITRLKKDKSIGRYFIDF